MKKTTILEFCLDYIENDETLSVIRDDHMMLIAFAMVACNCVEAYQKALIEGVELEASKQEE